MLQGIPLRNTDVLSMDKVTEIHKFDGIETILRGKIACSLYSQENEKNNEPIICAARYLSTTGTSVYDYYFTENNIVKGMPTKYMFLTPYTIGDFSLSVVIKTDNGFEYLYLDMGDNSHHEWFENENNCENKWIVRRSFLQTNDVKEPKYEYGTVFSERELANLCPYLNNIFFT
jgi:hypothetical protein